VQTMALLAPNFASASTAGTSLNNFLLRLQPTTDGATAAMIDLGLASDDGVSKFYDSEGAFIGMEAAAGLLQTSLAGLSEAEKTAALSVIFGNDAMRSALRARKGLIIWARRCYRLARPPM
jgi:TP901 family phage tail tape measure protein